jgi:hypothetical protein
MTEAVERQREKQSREDRIGTIHEAGRENRFVSSPTGTVHERPPLENGDGYALDPVCGQVLPEGSLWAGIDAEDAEEVATKYAKVSFCTKCFNRSLHLQRLGRIARQDHQ